jgi:flagellar motor switch protein FliG
LAKHLQREHPQIVAVVLAHLPPKRAADLLQHFDESMQVDVLKRVATLDATDPEVLRDVERELEMLLSDEMQAAKNRSEGLSAVRAILNAAGAKGPELLQHVAQHDDALMRQLIAEGQDASSQPQRRPPAHVAKKPTRSPTPVAPPTSPTLPTTSAKPPSKPTSPPKTAASTPNFNDLVGLDDEDFARLLQVADTQWTLLALAGASDEMMARITKRMGNREARLLRNRLQNLGPLRLDDIQQAQQRLAQLAARLADEGVIQLPGTRRFTVAA